MLAYRCTMNVFSFARAAMRIPRLCRSFYVRPGAGHADQLSAIGLPETDAHNLPVRLSFSCIWVISLAKRTALHLFGHSFAVPGISNSTLFHVALPTTTRTPLKRSQTALNTAWKFLAQKESPPFALLSRSRCMFSFRLAFIKTSA